MTLLVFGAGGQVGRAVMEQARGRAIGLDRAACDISDERAVMRAFAAGDIAARLNCAANTPAAPAPTEPEHA
jgi:dTDP-4-dehydrorhamnose reductase